MQTERTVVTKQRREALGWGADTLLTKRTVAANNRGERWRAATGAGGGAPAQSK